MDNQQFACSAPEIEITPEMIEAGHDALYDSVSLYMGDEPTFQEEKLVIRHILEAALKHH